MLNFEQYAIIKEHEAVLVKPNWFSEMLLQSKRLMKHKELANPIDFFKDNEEQELKEIQKHINDEYDLDVGNITAPTLFCLCYLGWLKSLDRTHDEDLLKEFTTLMIITPALEFNFENYNAVETELKKISKISKIYNVTYEDLFIDVNPVLDLDKQEIKDYTSENLEVAKKIARMAGNYDMIDDLDDYSVRVYSG